MENVRHYCDCAPPRNPGCIRGDERIASVARQGAKYAFRSPVLDHRVVRRRIAFGRQLQELLVALLRVQ